MSYIPYHIRGFKGVISDLGLPVPRGAFDDVLNFIPCKGRLTTRPPLIAFGAPPDGNPVRNGLASFVDIVGNIHTLVLTTQNPYFLTSGPTYNPLTGMTLPAGAVTGLPYSLVHANNRVYFCNGSTYVSYADGESSVKVSGNVPGSCQFLTLNANHLIGANWWEGPPTVAGSIFYPNKVRWSASGITIGGADDWLTDYSSGVNLLADVPDQITGLTTLGSNTYVFRTNGITVMFPTGVGLSPFQFENLAMSPSGVGCSYPYSLAVFNTSAIFVAKDDVYMLTDGSQIEPLCRGKNKKKLFTDLKNASGDQVYGQVIPSLGGDFDFLTYWLTMPGIGVTWIYCRENDSWQRFTSSKGWLTALQAVSVV